MIGLDTNVLAPYYVRDRADARAERQHEAARRLLSLSHVVVQNRERVAQAISHASAGLDLADALHLVSYRECESVAGFDDRKFAARARRMSLAPRVCVPG